MNQKITQFFEEKISLPAREYSRGELIAIATGIQATIAAVGESVVGGGSWEVSTEGIKDVTGLPLPADSVEVRVTPAGPPLQEERIAEAMIAEDAALNEAITRANLPWEGDAPKTESVDVLKSITWTKPEAPKGKPSLVHVFEVMAWLRADPKRRDAVTSAIFGDAKKPKMTKSWSGIGEAVSHMPVFDSARWLFTVMGEGATVKAFHEAFAEINIVPFALELRVWGLTMDGIDPGSLAGKACAAHAFMPKILNGDVEDGDGAKRPARKLLPANAGEIMIELKAAYDKLNDAQRQKMADHILKNYDTDKTKALAPLGKLMSPHTHAVIVAALDHGDVPPGVLALVFQSEKWDRIYGLLSACCDTKGPIPDWFTKET